MFDKDEEHEDCTDCSIFTKPVFTQSINSSQKEDEIIIV